MLCMQVCKEHSIPVRLEAPHLADMDSWQGVFITSTSRLLLPVCEIMYQQDHGPLLHKVGMLTSQYAARG